MPSLRTDKKSMKSNIDIATIYLAIRLIKRVCMFSKDGTGNPLRRGVAGVGRHRPVSSCPTAKDSRRASFARRRLGVTVKYSTSRGVRGCSSAAKILQA